MDKKERTVEHAAAARYEATRTLARRYVKEYRLDEQAFLWAVWFVFNGDQCGMRCPYRGAFAVSYTGLLLPSF